MEAILNYIFSMMPYMVLAIPVYCAFRFLLIRRKGRGINPHREVALLLFTLFMVGLASQTVIPKIKLDAEGISIVENRVHKTNLIPFQVIPETYREVFLQDNIQYFVINFLGNIAMFVPIGFFIPLLWEFSGKKVVFFGFCCSLLIEFIQLFLARGTDVDDLVLNTFGTLTGLALYKLVDKKARSFTAKFK